MPDIPTDIPDSAADRPGHQLARRHKAMEAIFGPRFRNTFASPYLVIEDHVIECPVGVRFFKKDFAHLSRQMYLEYQYRGWRDFDAALLDRWATIVANKLAALDATMQQTINRLQKLLDQHGLQADLTLWPARYVADVPIIAAHARTYLAVLQKMDRVYILTGTANLLGVIDSTQRAQAELAAKRAVRAFRSILQTEITHLYREAERITSGQGGRGDATPEPQQAEGVTQFDFLVPETQGRPEAPAQPPAHDMCPIVIELATRDDPDAAPADPVPSAATGTEASLAAAA